jgi:hypothetical protein
MHQNRRWNVRFRALRKGIGRPYFSNIECGYISANEDKLHRSKAISVAIDELIVAKQKLRELAGELGRSISSDSARRNSRLPGFDEASLACSIGVAGECQ